MQLTDVERLSLSTIHPQDTNNIAAISHSALLTSRLARLRYGNASQEEALKWLQSTYSVNLPIELVKPRISSLFEGHKADDPLPEEVAAEHIAIRDVDLPQIGSLNDSPSASTATHANGTIISYATYAFYPRGPPAATSQPSSSSEPRPQQPALPPPAGVNTTLESHWSELLATAMHSKFAPLACFCLESIATLTPSHLRQGTARRLVEWIFPYADRWGVPVVLAGSALGVRVYEKCGFVEVGRVDLDLGPWGWEKGQGQGVSDVDRWHRHLLMIRWPEDLQRLDGGWKEWMERYRRVTVQTGTEK